MTQPYSNADLPRKRVGASVIFVNGEGDVLIVKPSYRGGWLTPGGTVDENESPYEGAQREVREELGVALPVKRLACVGYRSAHGSKVENLQFVFWGGVLSNEQISDIRLPEQELSDFRFCPRDQLARYLNANLAYRCELALRAMAEGSVAYEEDMHAL